MSRGVNIPLVGCRNAMGMEVNIPWVGGRYAMVRRSIYHG